MNRFNSIYHSEEGLTLLEIMIAIVLLAFVMFGVVAITNNSQNTKDRTVQTDRDNLQIETAMARMDWDFSQLWSPLFFSQRFTGNLNPQSNPGIVEVAYHYENNQRFSQPSKEGLPIPRFQLRDKSDIIIFTTANRRKLENQKQADFMWVRYHLGDTTIINAGGEEKTVKSILRQVFPDDPWSREELDIANTRTDTLLENVEKLEFTVWNSQTRKWDTSLQSIPGGDSLIRGIKVEVTWKDANDVERSTVRWFRSPWPRVIPNDPAPNAGGGASSAGVQGGETAGNTQGGTTNSGYQGGSNAGSSGGFN
jgi:type II secretory pathway component PulJ